VLTYVQGETVDIWKENILEDLEAKVWKFETVKEFLKQIKKKFGEKEEESKKVVCYELKSLEWDKRTTLVLSNTRELDRELFYKLVYLI